MNIKHSDFPSPPLSFSSLFYFPFLPFPFFFFLFYFKQFWPSRDDKCSSDGELTFSIYTEPSIIEPATEFLSRYLWFSDDREREPRKIVNGRWGKRVNWIIKFSILLHFFIELGRWSDSVTMWNTEIQRFWLKYIYVCIRVLWDCNVEIFIFHVNSEKIGRCNCPARNRLHWKGSARLIEEFSGWFRMLWMGIDLSLEHERYEGKQNYLVLISSVILLRKCKEKSVYQLFRNDFI